MIYVSNSLLRRVFITYVYRCNCCLLFISRHFHYVILRMVDILALTATQSIVQSGSQNWCLRILDTPHSTWISGRMSIKGERDTLWLFNIAMENGPFIDDFPIETSIYKGFSMAMLNNKMVKGLSTGRSGNFTGRPALGKHPDHVTPRIFSVTPRKEPPHNRRLWSELNLNLNFVVSQQKPCICTWLSWIVCSSHFSIRPKRVVLFGLRSEIWNKTTRRLARLFGLPVEGDHACSPSLISIGMII